MSIGRDIDIWLGENDELNDCEIGIIFTLWEDTSKQTRERAVQGRYACMCADGLEKSHGCKTSILFDRYLVYLF